MPLIDTLTAKFLIGAPALLLGALVLEYSTRFFIERRKMPADGFANAVLFFPCNFLINVIGPYLLVTMVFPVEEWALFDIALSWWTLPLYILAGDFVFYGHHTWAHNCRLLWTDHAIHHSSEEYDFTTNLRLTPFATFYRAPFLALLVIVGFDPLPVIIFANIIPAFQTFCHTDRFVGKDLGWLDYVFVTPNNHAVHHASNPAYIDKNNGGLFVIFDQLFGTFKKLDPNDPPVFGVTTPIETHNPLKVVYRSGAQGLWEDLSEAPDWTTRFNILWRRPAWYAEEYKPQLENRANVGEEHSNG